MTQPHANSIGRILKISEKHHFVSKKYAKIVQNRENDEKIKDFWIIKNIFIGSKR